MRIHWTRPHEDNELLLARREVAAAYFAHLLRINGAALTESDVMQLRSFVRSLLRLIPLLSRQKSLPDELTQLLNFAAHAHPERSDTRMTSQFTVLYRGGVTGIRKFIVPRKLIVKPRVWRGVASDNGSVASRSYSLLTGELYQFVARGILQSLFVAGSKVKSIEELRPRKRKGKRVDDWLITTTNGEKIPAEVKVSRNLGYFDSAFKQIKNEKDGRGVFVGFYLSRPGKKPQHALVILIESGDRLGDFRRGIREMLSKQIHGNCGANA